MYSLSFLLLLMLLRNEWKQNIWTVCPRSKWDVSFIWWHKMTQAILTSADVQNVQKEGILFYLKIPIFLTHTVQNLGILIQNYLMTRDDVDYSHICIWTLHMSKKIGIFIQFHRKRYCIHKIGTSNMTMKFPKLFLYLSEQWNVLARIYVLM